jgi:hypothetical protein
MRNNFCRGAGRGGASPAPGADDDEGICRNPLRIWSDT